MGMMISNTNLNNRLWKRMGSGVSTLPGFRRQTLNEHGTKPKKNLVRRQFKEEENEEPRRPKETMRKKKILKKKVEDKKENSVILTDIPMNKRNLDIENGFKNVSSSMHRVPSKTTTKRSETILTREIPPKEEKVHGTN